MRLPAIKFKAPNSKLKAITKIWNLEFGIWNFKKGFTLIELLVVISIIGILATIAAASFTQAQMKARDGKRKTDLKAVQQALDLYYQTNGYYPINFAGIIRCNIQNPPGTYIDATLHVWGQSFFCKDKNNPASIITYMNPLPADPSMDPGTLTPRYYYLTSGASPVTYKLNSILENTNDPDYCDGSGTGCTKLPCQPQSGYNYCVIQP